MLRLSTARKLQILRGIRRVVLAGRHAAGQRSSRVTCARGGLNWSLDLDEGIDLSIFLLGSFEPLTARLIARLLRPGMTAIDIGANVGAHALPMAKAVGPAGRVFAIEPTAWAFDRLSSNLSLNPELKQSLVAIHGLLGQEGTVAPAAIYSSWNIDAPSAAKHPVHGGSAHSLGDARVLTLDQMIEEHRLVRVDLVKLDVDGFECSVLRGGLQALARFAPPIVFELAPYALAEQGSSLGELLEILRGLGYEFRFEWSQELLPASLDEISKLIVSGGSRNVLAVSAR